MRSRHDSECIGRETYPCCADLHPLQSGVGPCLSASFFVMSSSTWRWNFESVLAFSFVIAICWSRSWELQCWSKADTENVNSVDTLGLGAAARACEATKRRSHMPVYQCVTSREQLGTEEKLGLKTCRWFARPSGVRESAIISHQGVHQTWNLSNQTFYTSMFTRNVKMYPKVGRQSYVREREQNPNLILVSSAWLSSTMYYS